MEKELKNMYNAMKVQKGKDAGVERSSLISLLQYYQLDV